MSFWIDIFIIIICFRLSYLIDKKTYKEFHRLKYFILALAVFFLISKFFIP